jgi:capsid portal protein
MANKEVKAALAPQVNNGRILDQTIWSYHFEIGTDKLTPGGLEHLAYIARRRPCPDCMVYLQTATLADLGYDFDNKNPDKLTEARAELDIKRKQAIQKFLVAQTVGQMAFQVAIHDPAEVGIEAPSANSAYQKMVATRFQGGLTQGGGAGGAGGQTGAGGAPGAVQTNPPGQ